MTRDEALERAKKVFGNVYLSWFLQDGDGYEIGLTPNDTDAFYFSFDTLQAAAREFQTEDINFSYEGEGPDYSEYTPGNPSKLELVIRVTE